ncbi:MAG: type III secretion system chaperone [Actinomycetota bacterium]
MGLRSAWGWGCLAVLLSAGAAQAQKPAAKRPAPKPSAAKPAAPKPAAPKPVVAATPPRLTAANLGAHLLAQGYLATVKDGAHRVRVEEDSYGYHVDVKVTPSGDWLVCTAHLAPIPDLTKVPATPLLSLLGANDQLLGMYFSYDRETAQIVLNAAVPVRGVEPAALKTILESLKITIKKTEGLWDPSTW